MSATRLPAAQHQSQPWKNGLGVSRIIAGDPPGAGIDTRRWQVGSTEISADCPFSDLTGLDRQFMVIEGAGVELTGVDEAGVTTHKRIDAQGEESCRVEGVDKLALVRITAHGR